MMLIIISVLSYYSHWITTPFLKVTIILALMLDKILLGVYRALAKYYIATNTARTRVLKVYSV